MLPSMKTFLKLAFGTLGLALLVFGGVKTFQYFKPDRKSGYVKQKPLPVSDQKPFVIVIPSYNNSCYVKKIYALSSSRTTAISG